LTEIKSFLWDSCVLYRWLSKSPDEYVNHIDQHLKDAIAGRANIFISSVALAELRPSKVSMPGLTPAAIMSKLLSVIKVVDANPDIMSMAGSLKDHRFIAFDDPKAKERTRELGTGDAIQLATAVWMNEIAEVKGLEFHTFDDGKARHSIDGKCVPLLSFQNWCKGLDDAALVQSVKAIKRKIPEHDQCPLPQKSNSKSLEGSPAPLVPMSPPTP
jgi:hypothetical protein